MRGGQDVVRRQHEDARLGLGETHFKEGGAGNLVLAISEYREFLTLYPSHPRSDYAQFQTAEAYYLRGRVYLELGRENSAKPDFAQAITLNPDHRGALFWRGFITKDRDPKNALVDFGHAYELEPDPWSLFYKGDCLLALGRRDEAEGVYNDALALTKDPKFHDEKLEARLKDAIAKAKRQKHR